ncbi:hypothetical protein V496_07803 [Pseudogymnoascus sp. VKM F-4515 (FW-2607)]|nr:hypothetical protein V496_07803 [Pseudogymnoascus sp. VKM F-4515 (FW-2607)]KFY96713.1 hypothetical protein V498_02516 [Pseudogymnoascus sp. VKM F-4517 (FW-2822)]
MESLAGTSWDVVIEGTGLQQSLLALALSRSDKKVLHVDGNNYYGGPEAAFSLQEAEAWAESLTATPSSPFSKVSWRKPETSESSTKKLSPSRAYTLTLSPHIIYAKSKLVSQLVSSQVYRQLEFQAVGNWWLYEDTSGASPDAHEAGTLKRMPNGREDIFSDRSIDVRAKRGLMKFIKFVVDFENQAALWETHADTPFAEFLASQFQLPPSMQTYLVALTLSLEPATVTSVGYALPRIARHLTSIGVFGPGFGAVVPKWGGGAEIAQVACRALAVGGGVYVLGTGISGADTGPTDVSLKLTNDEAVQAGYYISSQDKTKEIDPDAPTVSKMVAVVSSDLSSLFVSTVEGAPVAAVAVVAFPADTVVVDGQSSPHPIFIMVHSSDSGECPQGQYVLYASTTNIQNPKGRLEAALSKLLNSADAPRADGEGSEQDAVLFELYYEQSRSSTSNLASKTSCALPPSSLDLSFDDSTLDGIEDAWRRIMGSPETESPYMVFETREQLGDEDDNGMDGL